MQKRIQTLSTIIVNVENATSKEVDGKSEHKTIVLIVAAFT